MNDTQWSEEQAAPAKKKRFPSWVWWGCGGGCALVVLVFAAVAILGGRMVKRGMDPEVQWPRLEKVLAFEERPEGLELEFGMDLGAEQFHLRDTRHGLAVTIFEFPLSAKAGYEQFLDPENSPIGLGKTIDPEAGTIAIQGREVPCLRFAGVRGLEANDRGSGIRVDLTGDRSKPRLLELRSGRDERIEDAVVEEFLAPFQVWKAP